MYQINFSSDQRDLMVNILEQFLANLRAEIGRTDDWQYRERLKQQETQIKELLGMLANASQSANETRPIAG